MSIESATILWNGFHFRWQNNPHRLSSFATCLENLSPKPKAVTADHRFKARIGNWPEDTGQYRVPYTKIRAKGLFLGTGRQTIRVKSVFGSPAHENMQLLTDLRSLTSTFDAAQLDLREFNQFQLFLNGFCIEPVNNPSGWHFGGLALRLGKTGWGGGKRLQTDLEIFLRPSRPPERIMHGNRDWKNPGKPHCIYEITLDYLLVAGREGEVQFHHFRNSETVKRKGRASREFTVGAEFSAPDAGGFAGITGFDFRIEPNSTARHPRGCYFRELGALVETSPDLPEPGKFQASGQLVFSNKGKFTLQWELASALELAVVEFPAAKLWVTEGEVSGTVDKTRLEDVVPLGK